MKTKILSSYLIEHKNFENLRHTTEFRLRKLTLCPDSGMNEELTIKDKDSTLVMFRFGNKRQIIGWALVDSKNCCQVFVMEKYRNLKTENNQTVAELLVSSLYNIHPFKGYYVHDLKSDAFWRKMLEKHFKDIEISMYDNY